LRAGLFRPLCTNGLVSQIGDFGLLHVPHRGNVIHNVVDGALQIARGFNDITRVVERMAARTLSDQARREFAAAALRVRYPDAEQHVPVLPDQLLSARRHADFGNSLWLTYNVVQAERVGFNIVNRVQDVPRFRTQLRLERAIYPSVAVLGRRSGVASGTSNVTDAASNKVFPVRPGSVFCQKRCIRASLIVQ
jgi:hypothetical protein